MENINSTIETYDDLIKNEVEINGYVINSFCNIQKITYKASKNVIDTATSEKIAKSMLAMAQISQLMPYYGGEISESDWNDETVIKYYISKVIDVTFNEMTICRGETVNEYYFLAFYSRLQRDLFLMNNMQLVDDYLMYQYKEDMEKSFEISIKIDRDKMKELDSNSKQSFIAFRNTICKLIAEKNKCSVVDAEFIFMDVATDNIMSINVTEKQYNEIICVARPLLSKCVIITETKMMQDETVTISVKEYDELKRVKGLYFDLLGSLKSITNQFESQLENIIKRY